MEHAHVEADKTQAEVGETITFTITTDEDYHVSSFKVNGNDVTITGNKATATMVENGLTVTIAVEANTHDVTIHSSENGTVVADKTTAIVGDKVTFTITPMMTLNWILSKSTAKQKKSQITLTKPQWSKKA